MLTIVQSGRLNVILTETPGRVYIQRRANRTMRAASQPSLERSDKRSHGPIRSSGVKIFSLTTSNRETRNTATRAGLLCLSQLLLSALYSLYEQAIVMQS